MSQDKRVMREPPHRAAVEAAQSAAGRAPSLRFVMLTAVRVLFGVLLLSTVVIVWVAIAVARHIAQHRRAIRSQAEPHDDPV
ncbi:MAG: hypothetical protein WB622_19845 [Acidobacteriaceae bacterium]|jgi:hypothetical protein